MQGQRNYNYNKERSADRVVLRERAVRTSCGFSLIYRLIKRTAVELEGEHIDVYDVQVIKKNGASGGSHSLQAEAFAELSAISSDLSVALGFYNSLVKNTVTPTCVGEIAEEYLFDPKDSI